MENKKDNAFPHFMNNNNLLKCKKAQAAMEFLMTYGWALLVVIIAVGVLAWLGIFNPNKYISDSCMVSSPLSCDEFVVKKNTASVSPNTIQLVIGNGAGDTISISKVDIAGCGSTAAGWSLPVPDGARGTIPAITCAPIITADRFKGNILVTYKKSTGTLDLVSSGSIAAKATN